MGSLHLSEEEASFHLGQRFSYDGALCTIRYHGVLPGTKGVWLGVEWDDVDRGKHDGTYQGRRYFHCLSSAPASGSFIRPSRIPDPPRSFLDALRFKYAAEDTDQPASARSSTVAATHLPSGNFIEISGKVVEEVGFERIRQQQAVLQNLRIVLLDGLFLSRITLKRHDSAATAAAQEAVAQTCPDLVELDLGWNLLETWTDVAEICLPLKSLQVLKASGLRLHQFDLPQALEEKQPFRHVTELHVNENMLQPEQIPILVGSRKSALPRFPALKILSISQNRLSELQTFRQGWVDLKLPNVTTLILDNNLFTSLAMLSDVLHVFPSLKVLSLRGNQIRSTGVSSDSGSKQEAFSFPQLESLNLSHNLIQGYSFIDAVPRLFPRLTSLRVSNNPFFSTGTRTHPPARDDILHRATISSSTSSAPPAHTSDLPGVSGSDSAYSLTLARIPTLLALNHSTITSRDREEGEIYYTSLAERELSAAIATISLSAPSREAEVLELKKRYPRYEEMCRKYERDSVFETLLKKKADGKTASDGGPAYAPGTLGARLIKTRFYILQKDEETSNPITSVLPTTSSRLIPRSISVYTLKAFLSRTFSLPALQFRLIYESPELDPVRDSTYQASSWETWGDWDLDHPPEGDGVVKEGKKWKKREVEILDGTREWGFYLEDGVGEVTIRLEPFKRADSGVGKS